MHTTCLHGNILASSCDLLPIHYQYSVTRLYKHVLRIASQCGIVQDNNTISLYLEYCKDMLICCHRNTKSSFTYLGPRIEPMNTFMQNAQLFKHYSYMAKFHNALVTYQVVNCLLHCEKLKYKICIYSVSVVLSCMQAQWSYQLAFLLFSVYSTP